MALNRAEADLKKAKTELAKLQLQVEFAHSRVQKLEHYIEMARIYEATDGDEADAAPKRRGGVVTAVIEVLRESHAAMQTRDILDALKKRSIDIGGTNPITNLSSALSRAEDLINVPGVGWTLKDAADVVRKAPAQEAPSHSDPFQEMYAQAGFSPPPAPPLPSGYVPANTYGGGGGFTPSGPDLDDEIPF